jgi:hypothetical protein
MSQRSHTVQTPYLTQAQVAQVLASFRDPAQAQELLVDLLTGNSTLADVHQALADMAD